MEPSAALDVAYWIDGHHLVVLVPPLPEPVSVPASPRSVDLRAVNRVLALAEAIMAVNVVCLLATAVIAVYGFALSG
jgi:hypothetical protein